jgi:hypothetical protein
MKMVAGFFEEAFTFLAQHPEVGGVSGRLIELNNESLEYRERALRAPTHLMPGEVDRLDGGGLYRRRAVEETGFLSDRNLHSYEEFDLGVRLRSRGALGEPHLKLVLRGVRELRIYAAVLAWWALLLTVPFWPISVVARVATFMGIAAAPFVAMAIRKRSVSRSVYSVVSWCFNAAGMVTGLLRPRVHPRGLVASRILHEPPRSSESQHRQHYA